MSSVVHRESCLRLRSVHTPDYPTSQWLVNPPGLAALDEAGVPVEYCKVVGEDVLEMSVSEKAAVDAAAAAQATLEALLDAKVVGRTQIIASAYSRILVEEDVVSYLDQVEAATTTAEVDAAVAAYFASF